MIILDTNVLSEPMKPEPSAQVLRWLAAHPPEQFFTTTVTQAEILYGLELLAKGKRRSALMAAMDAMFDEDFAGRILPFDVEAAPAFPALRRIAAPVDGPSPNPTCRSRPSPVRMARHWRRAMPRISQTAASRC
jgi:predicted nucleic acid-binding protein